MRLSDFDLLNFIIDDSGSMDLNSDVKDSDGRRMTRWEEAISRMRSLIEIIAYVPIKKIRIQFLNDRRTIEHVRRGSEIGETPGQFIKHMFHQLSKAKGPGGGTPALEVVNFYINIKRL
jgi:hypothetical protein